MNGIRPTVGIEFDDKEVRCVNTNVIPFSTGFLIALDLKLRHSTVAIVIHFQT